MPLIGLSENFNSGKIQTLSFLAKSKTSTTPTKSNN